jgi:hypothetical protein
MNTEILIWLGPSWEGDLGGVKGTRGEEPIGVVIHIWMETTQGNSMCSYLKLAKTSCFSFYLFSSAISENRRVEQALGEGDGTSGRGEVTDKCDRRMNTVQIMCAHICKCKNDTC